MIENKINKRRLGPRVFRISPSGQHNDALSPPSTLIMKFLLSSARSSELLPNMGFDLSLEVLELQTKAQTAKWFEGSN